MSGQPGHFLSRLEAWMQQSSVKLDRGGPWRSSSGRQEPISQRQKNDLISSTAQSGSRFFSPLRRIGTTSSITPPLHAGLRVTYTWGCTSPWCERLTSVLATFPLCVMFLLCFSLAMRILCLATIFRDDDHKATAEMKPVLGLFSQLLRDVGARCWVKLSALQQSLTGSAFAVVKKNYPGGNEGISWIYIKMR